MPKRRINSHTHKPYKKWDKPTSEDLPRKKGMVFANYNLSRVNENGFYREGWMSTKAKKNI